MQTFENTIAVSISSALDLLQQSFLTITKQLPQDSLPLYGFIYGGSKLSDEAAWGEVGFIAHRIGEDA